MKETHLDERPSPKATRANQEFFDILAGDIFARLYHAFPAPTDLIPDGIIPALGGQEEIDDNPERMQALYGHTVQWLSDEGYLRFGQAAHQDEDDSVAFFDVVLTSKGLEALRKTPGSLTGPGETLGEKIEETAKDISSDAAKDLMKQLIPLALGWIKGMSGL
uniref:Uncharacterized protein n=1 Tax=Bradyrhizobium ottawaense TaxID=931866 RepID=A0A2U8PDA8_9BRAD|nr:hypothetical protein CIT37_29140 [Bradyrhizobium ottawaense]